jgi:hypothetical protein
MLEVAIVEIDGEGDRHGGSGGGEGKDRED